MMKKNTELKIPLKNEFRLEDLMRIILIENTPLNLNEPLAELLSFLRRNKHCIYGMGYCDQKNTEFYVSLRLEHNLSEHESALIGKYIQSTHVSH